MSVRRSAPAWEPPVDGESSTEAHRRRYQNRLARDEWRRFISERCASCGFARGNVRHETDPATAPEGPDYYADMDDLHEFVAATTP